MGLGLCTRGTLGKSTGTLGSKSTGTLDKGTLRTYPPSRVPTHPFRVLGLSARGNILGELSWCK